MADKTEIAWCDSTFNPWIGCAKVGPGCDNCYAEADFDHRKHRVKWGAGQERSRTSAANWKKPLQWNRKSFYECTACGWRGEEKIVCSFPTCQHCHSRAVKPARRRVFCASLADVFDNEVPVEWRRNLFELIKNTPNLDWLLLTKRIGNAARMIEEAISELDIGYDPDYALWPWPNVWLGATVVNQEEADRDIPKLLATPAAVRWISAEPLLRNIDLTHISQSEDDGDDIGGWKHCDAIASWGNALTGEWFSAERRGYTLSGHERSFTTAKVDWVIVGGESGQNSRPMHPDWVRSLRDQCADAGVPFLFKQWGEYLPAEDGEPPSYFRDAFGRVPEIWPKDMPGVHTLFRVGKKRAGRMLDGHLHNDYPGGAS